MVFILIAINHFYHNTSEMMKNTTTAYMYIYPTLISYRNIISQMKVQRQATCSIKFDINTKYFCTYNQYTDRSKKLKHIIIDSLFRTFCRNECQTLSDGHFFSFPQRSFIHQGLLYCINHFLLQKVLFL